MSNTATPARPARKRWPIVAAIVIAAVLGVFGYRAMTPASSVPDATFTLLSGQKVSTGDLKGKVYLVNFWATSCVTCVKEMPQMIDTYKQYKDKGLDFVAVAMNYDPPMYVANYARTRELPFKVAMDSDGSAAKAFGDVQLTPTTFVVDKNGKILKRYVGEPEWDALHKLLDGALASAA
ncbi:MULTISPECIES: TlpA disulfide reductase family protein [Cupriavidus]|uniref:TlpA family protein disulfide reductase n=1 Tax=Cupriavidus pauculus TaxID=82633 RepID=A0A3G8GX74_9BURK|nr:MULTISPECIES: TlpA disulfide reductase family protein [Cupriavidus]AZG12714.1 TlpA family protein disulfide reductase [Cupriavidus pauculus]MDT6962358.1 TlpA disulfide reductase family protein [Cupriavidus sp. SZY C1]